MLGLPGSLIEVTEWLVGMSCHLLDLGIHHMCLLCDGRDGTENRRCRRYFSDVEMVCLERRSLDGIGTVIDGEGLVRRQCWVGVLKGTGETLATTRSLMQYSANLFILLIELNPHVRLLFRGLQ